MKRSVFAAVLSAVLASGLLVGCGQGSEKDLLASARNHIAKKEPKSAIVNLKNVLQKNPQSPEGRFLLGKVLLENANPPAATLELGRALDLKYPIEEVLPLLVRSMDLEGKDKQIIDLYGRIELNNPNAAADLKGTLAVAYAKLGQPEQAQAQIEAALKLVPNHVPALLLKAGFKAQAGEFQEATALLDKLTAIDSQNAEAWQLRGDIIASTSGDMKAAIAAYQKSIDSRKQHLTAYSRIIIAELRNHDVPAAQAKLDQMVAVAGKHPQTLYMSAQVKLVQGKNQEARELVEQLLKIAPTNIYVLQIAGALEYNSGHLLQAENFLARALQLEPTLGVARRLLAQTYLRNGQAQRALTLVTPLLDVPTPDNESLSVAAESHLMMGNVGAAEQLFSRAAQINPNDPKVRTALALTQLARGQADIALGSLKSIAASDASDLADLALISARLRRKEYDAALEATAVLEKKQPDKPLASSLQGKVLLAMGKFAEARKSFERAMKIDPMYLPAATSLASLDLQDKQAANARLRFEGMLKNDPRNYSIQLALAELMTMAGAPRAQIAETLQNAVKLNPAEPGPRVALVRHYLSGQEYKLALAAAQEGAASVPDNADVMDALGVAQLRAGDVQQAISAFNKVTMLDKRSALPYLRLAEAHSALNNNKAAITSLRRALEIAPDLVVAQRALVIASIRSKDVGQAISVAQQVQKQRPKESVGYLLEGDVESSRKNYAAAAVAFRTALQYDRSSDAIVKLYSALVEAKRTAEAEQIMATWLKDHPQDVTVLLFAGSRAIMNKNYALAEQRYDTALRLQPESATAHNNKAWLLIKAGKPGAVAEAEQATKLMPNQPSMTDTLALALSLDGQAQRALELQKKVVAAAPDVYLYRLTLARIYLKLGDKVQGRQELERLAKLGARFDEQDEVTELLKTL